MNSRLLSISLFFIILLFISCTKDDAPSSPDIYGSWTVLQTDQDNQQYNVELKFNIDNSYDWILLDSAAGHSNSHAEFSLIENVMVINNDADCNFQGEYLLIKESNKLAIISVSEECVPRALALEYIWKKHE
jgi:hypothetical protein